MPLYGKEKNVSITWKITVAIDKGDKTYTSYSLTGDRDACVAELEKGANWGVESVELQNEPPKNSTEKSSVKVKSVKLLSYPSTTKGKQDSGVYKYYVDSPTRGAGSVDRLWLSDVKTELKTQTNGDCNKTTKIHPLTVELKITAKAIIQADSKSANQKR